MTRKFLFVLSLLVVIGCATTNPNLGRPAPDFTLTDLSGRVVKLEDFKGNNVLLLFYVNFD